MKKLLAALLLTTGFLFAAEEKIPDNPEEVLEHEKMPARATLNIAGTVVDIPVLTVLTAEDLGSYVPFLTSKGSKEVAIALINATNDVLLGATVSAVDYLKYLRIVDHFTTGEDAQKAIRVLTAEEKNDPEKLASVLRMNLSRVYFKVNGADFFEIPVASLKRAEHDEYMAFWRTKNLARARQLVQTAQGFLTCETLSGTDFLKFLRIADRYPTNEEAQQAFAGID